MVERQYIVQDRIDRLCPVLWFQIQRDHLLIKPRVFQPCQKISQVIDRDSLPPKPSFFKVRKIVFQKDTCRQNVPDRSVAFPSDKS